MTIHHDSEDLESRLQFCQSQLDDNTELCTANKTEIDTLKEENTILNGIVHRFSNKLEVLNDRVVKLTARSMQKNVTLNRLTGDSPSENSKETVVDFVLTR